MLKFILNINWWNSQNSLQSKLFEWEQIIGVPARTGRTVEETELLIFEVWKSHEDDPALNFIENVLF